ncbi:MAG TPA: aldo/keto reductase [Bacteroides sp.]|nr:aldo/keto reductase [Bacteroides sp.]
MDIKTRILLNNGVEIPVVGLGVYQSPIGEVTRNAVRHALNAGYRHIDTARVYRNEPDVGIAVAGSGIPREEIFITTKLWNADQGYEPTLAACEKSLERMNLDYVDLYLIHWPVEDLRLESWRAMEKLLSEGRCRAIGVSNYMVHHLEELLENSETVPAINQIEMSPYNYLLRIETIKLCRKRDIKIEAYSPLTQGQKLEDHRLIEIAGKYNKTTAQILIRWSLQKDFIVLPKSVHQNRIIENAAVYDFNLSAEDIEILDGLNENLVTGWDPTNAP